MNPLFLVFIAIPSLEIFLMIKIGVIIGALNTVSLIFLTAVLGIYYAKYEGLKTLRSGFIQISKNEPPTFEMISGAAIAFAAILLIIPGFATDFLGFVLIFPISREFIFKKFKNKFKSQKNERNNYIDGEYEDIEEDNDRKL